ncbi:hypothetical protein B4U80_04694 [Leptotrombidium deliense]|uniref:RNA-directed DNA polymerase n=1 Tax=Leptotrombidium deliense TaxID=299467 RepID=A0A443S738_9ACAR|nr:hypothetical protein B4U80_04694 [Leptotrombidium deliense]
MRQELQRQINEMIELGVASPTISEYSSPVVMVKKADGEYRMCVDLREINKKIKGDNYPLPHINDILHALNGACWFCVFDMNAGYWQIPIRKSDRHFLAFITQDTLCHFNLLPFGLKSAPTFFQRVMDYVLSGLKWSIVVVYLDDLVVMGYSFDALIKNTGSVLQRFADFGLTIKASKCKFGVTAVTFLGHVISCKGIMMDRNKVSAILKMEPPTTKRDIRVFLGKVGFYGRFHKNLQVVAQPLTRRLRKDVEMGWGLEEQNAFDKIIESLAQYPILRHFDSNLAIELTIDACGIGCGYVLGQIYSDGFHTTMYGSRQFSDREKLLPPHDQEAIGLGYACKSTESIIKGYKVTVKTDNCAVCHINRKTKLSPQMMRVALLIQKFEIEHKRGTHNKDADCLSRFPVNPLSNIGDNTKRSIIKHNFKRVGTRFETA